MTLIACNDDDENCFSTTESVPNLKTNALLMKSCSQKKKNDVMKLHWQDTEGVDSHVKTIMWE